jgi:GAF domain-containing protein
MGSEDDGGVSTGHDRTERKRPEAARPAADLEAMTKLREVGALFAREGNLDSVLGEIVDAAITISGSDFGTIQLLNCETGDLEIVAHRGFPQWWLTSGAAYIAEWERAGQRWSAQSGSSSRMSSAAPCSPALLASKCN